MQNHRLQIAYILCLLAVCSSFLWAQTLVQETLPPLEGEWLLENMFSQNIEPGVATLQKMEDEIISRIQFTTRPVRTLDDNTHLKTYAARVTLLDASGKYGTHEAEYLDLSGIITLSIKTTKPKDLTMFTCTKDSTTRWYSISLSGQSLQSNEIERPLKSDKAFCNIIGIMRKQNSR